MADRVQIKLADGRRLDIRVSGDWRAVPLVFHHGTPGAAVPFRAVERAAHEAGLRFLTMSRPGYGGSSRHQGRAVVDAAADTAEALTAIGANRCLVAGWSGGGPHALACAARLKGTAAALVIAGVAPFPAPGIDWLAGMGEDNLAEFGAAFAGEDQLRPFLEAIRPHLQNTTVAHIVESLGTLLPDVDRAVLTDEFGEDMVASFADALRVSADGWIDDDLAFVKPWGFDLDQIKVPVSLWQGSADLMVPFAHGQWLAEHVFSVSAHLEPGEGHLSIGLGAIEPMLDELITASGLRADGENG